MPAVNYEQEEARKNPLYKKTYVLTNGDHFSSSGAASQALSSFTESATLKGSAGLNGYSIQPVLFDTPALDLLVRRGAAASKADFDWLVTNKSMLYVEDPFEGTLHFQLVDADGENTAGGADNRVILIEYE